MTRSSRPTITGSETHHSSSLPPALAPLHPLRSPVVPRETIFGPCRQRKNILSQRCNFAAVQLTPSTTRKEMDSQRGTPLPCSISGEGWPPRSTTAHPDEVPSIPPPPLCSDHEEAEGNASEVFRHSIHLDFPSLVIENKYYCYALNKRIVRKYNIVKKK
jgi:hypothetical protein